jgi:hypothetical protein
MIGFVNEKHLFFLRPVHNGPLERMIGIEPTSPTWKDGVITIIRHPLMERKTGLEPATLTLAR